MEKSWKSLIFRVFSFPRLIEFFPVLLLVSHLFDLLNVFPNYFNKEFLRKQFISYWVDLSHWESQQITVKNLIASCRNVNPRFFPDGRGKRSKLNKNWENFWTALGIQGMRCPSCRPVADLCEYVPDSDPDADHAGKFFQCNFGCYEE